MPTKGLARTAAGTAEADGPMAEEVGAEEADADGAGRAGAAGGTKLRGGLAAASRFAETAGGAGEGGVIFIWREAIICCLKLSSWDWRNP